MALFMNYEFVFTSLTKLLTEELYFPGVMQGLSKSENADSFKGINF